jgi:FAD:protein FMN transferase
MRRGDVTLAASALIMLSAATAFGSVTRAQYLMGTICEITVPDSPAAAEQVDAAFGEARRIEGFLSTWREDTELSSLNRSGGGVVSPELYQLLETAIAWSGRTGGAFNPLVRPLLDLWKTRGEGAVPDALAIHDALARIQTSNVRFDHGVITLANGARFEEGAFGKGYAIDHMIDVLRGRGATSALINFGGQLASFGDPREVSVADPEHRDQPLVPVTLRNASLSTSSGSERSFVVHGRRFTHIFDPRTGEALPPLGSVSVLNPSALVADILSTALYVMGPEEGARWAREHQIEAIFITPHRRVIHLTHAQ